MASTDVIEELATREECLELLETARAQIHNLEIALISARRIGTAVGIVMATYKVSDEAAFDLLVVASQNSHRKLRDIAQDVVETGDLSWRDMNAPSKPAD